MSRETPALEQRGVEIVPKEERTVGFWDLFVIWGGFSIIITNFLLGALGVGVGIGPAILAHMIGILIVAGVVWLGTILGSEQGIAGTVAMRSAFGINGRYIASVVMFIVGIGWFGVQTGMVGSAAYEIVKDLVPAIAFTPRVWMVITGILMALVAIFGYRAIVWLNRLAIPGLVVLLTWLTYKIPWRSPSRPDRPPVRASSRHPSGPPSIEPFPFLYPHEVAPVKRGPKSRQPLSSRSRRARRPGRSRSCAPLRSWNAP